MKHEKLKVSLMSGAIVAVPIGAVSLCIGLIMKAIAYGGLFAGIAAFTLAVFVCVTIVIWLSQRTH